MTNEKELKPGDTVYQCNGVKVFKSVIKNVVYETDSVCFDKTAIGTSIFLTEEEAKKHLA